MAAEGGAIITFIFNGEDRANIPQDVTHLIIHENITVIPERLFYLHPNLVGVYCHAGVTEIKLQAFYCCRSLRRVIIPGVTIIKECAFFGCTNLIHVECDTLERIGASAFSDCDGLGSINLPSAKIVELYAFAKCYAMTQAIFGKDLESIGELAFINCRSLELITIPLKSGLLTEDNIFKWCFKLKRVDLVEGESLGDFADALLLESWRNDMNEELDSIYQNLLNAAPGDDYNVGRKAIAIREWIDSLLRKVTHYKAAHREILSGAASELQHSLPNDIVMNNILPFVELPADSFDWEDEAE